MAAFSSRRRARSPKTQSQRWAPERSARSMIFQPLPPQSGQTVSVGMTYYYRAEDARGEPGEPCPRAGAIRWTLKPREPAIWKLPSNPMQHHFIVTLMFTGSTQKAEHNLSMAASTSPANTVAPSRVVTGIPSGPGRFHFVLHLNGLHH